MDISFIEPELPEVSQVDRTIVRNIIYTSWALNSNGDPCIGWQVQNKSDGYIVLISFGKSFSVALQDLQLISDVNPLRISSICVRNPEISSDKKVGLVLVIKVLDQYQPVTITESDIVRVRKRHRGFLSCIRDEL